MSPNLEWGWWEDSAAQFGQQIGGMHRLREDFELVAIQPRLFQQVGGGRLARKEQNLAIRHLRPGRDCGLDAGHSGHDDVGDEQVRLEALERFNRLFAAVDGARFEPGLIQDDGKRVSDYLFVVGYEYLAFGRCCGWRIRHAWVPK